MVRYKIDPRDLPAEKVGRLLHISKEQFEALLPRLYDRGFPQPDPTTGHWDSRAVSRWMDLRSSLTADDGLTAGKPLRNAGDVFSGRLRQLDG